MTVLSLWLGAWVLEGAPPTAEKLFRSPDLLRAHLSPDGTHVVLVAGDERGSISLFDTATAARQPLEIKLNLAAPGAFTPAVRDTSWLGSTRLLLTTNFTRIGGELVAPQSWLAPSPEGSRLVAATGPFFIERRFASYSGFTAVDTDGREKTDLPGVALRTDELPGSTVPPFMWDARKIFVPAGQPGIIFAPAYEGGPTPHPALAKIDTLRGTASGVIASSPQVTEWLPAPRGDAVLGVEGSSKTTRVLTRKNDSSDWIEIADLGVPRSLIRLERWDPQRGLIYAGLLGKDGRWMLSAFDLRGKKWLPSFVQSDRYDVAPADHRDNYASLDLTQILFSPKTGLPLAIDLDMDIPRQSCADSRMKEVQSRLQAAAPELMTHLVEIDETEDKVLAFSWSGRQPGFYTLVELATGKTTRIADRMPWLDPVELGEMTPRRFKARDGTEIDAYVTLPPRRAVKQLPLVLLLRTLPRQRDIWGFQPLVQFLATRGYAVLQVNQRGSSGYGEAFANAGGDGMDGVWLDDIADAARWATSSGLADPKRLAVVGTGFGGTCALMALAHEADLFCCGVAIDAVTDWNEVFRDKSESPYLYWFRWLGALPNIRSKQQLRDCSPITFADRIQAPLLLGHNSANRRTPIRHAKVLAAAMQKAHREVETFFYEIDRLNRANADKQQIAVYERMAAFLAQHLPAAGDESAKYGSEP